MTVEEFAARIEAAIVQVHPRIDASLTVIGEHAKELACSFPGHYQEGWRPLAPSTIARKQTGDSPLLETGEMKESIEFQVDPTHLEISVGSHEEKALWQEMGTHRIPPRPFLSKAIIHSEPFAVETLGKAVVKILMGNR